MRRRYGRAVGLARIGWLIIALLALVGPIGGRIAASAEARVAALSIANVDSSLDPPSDRVSGPDGGLDGHYRRGGDRRSTEGRLPKPTGARGQTPPADRGNPGGRRDVDRGGRARAGASNLNRPPSDSEITER